MQSKIHHASLMQNKYNAMLISGMMGVILVSVALMSGTLVAGTFLGSQAVQAVTLVSPLYSICAFTSYLVSYGFPVLYSYAMGKMDRQEADLIFGTALFLSVLIGIFNFAFLALAGSWYLRSYHPAPEVYALAMQYLPGIRAAVLGLPLVCVMNGAVYADGDQLIYNIASVTQLVSTLVFSALFCKIFGIAGISIGFAAPIWLASLICCAHLFRAGNTLKIGFRCSWRITLQIARYSLPDASKCLFSALFTSVMNYYVAARFGASCILFVSAVQLIRDAETALDSPGQGAAPILSVYLGEGSFSGVRNIYRTAEKSAVILGTLFLVLVFIFAPVIPDILGAAEPALAFQIMSGVRILCLNAVFVALMFWLSSYYIVLGRVGLSVLMTGLYDSLIPILCSVLAGRFFGVYGWFFGLMIAPGLVFAGLRFVMHRLYGKEDARYLIKNREAGSFSQLYELDVTPQEIIRVRDEAGKYLLEKNISSNTVNRCMLLIEEFFMLIYNRNGNDAVQGECILNVSDKVDIIIRDSGTILDLTDPDLSLDSIRAYIVPLVVDTMTTSRQHLSAIGFNRNRFVVK